MTSPRNPALRETQAPSWPASAQLDIIWNLTLVCPWDCPLCCVDAVHATKRDGMIVLRSEGLQNVEQVPFVPGHGSIYDQALRHRQRQGRELDLPGKLRVLDHLRGFQVKLDFSGGDVLSVTENLLVLRAATAALGRERITLTATGAGLAHRDIGELAELVGEFNFTYDSDAFDGKVLRPNGYAAGNFRKASEFARLGVPTRAECPLTMHIVEDDALLTHLYENLHEAGIGKLLLMRLFPVGRGMHHAPAVPTSAQYRHAIELLRSLEAKYRRPELKLQCALKFFDEAAMRRVKGNPCDLLHESFGLTANGTLLASPWAVNASGQPLHEAWILGNLATTPMAEILASKKVQAYLPRLDENVGHCKIFAFLSSTQCDPADRLFDRADPLYVEAEALHGAPAA